MYQSETVWSGGAASSRLTRVPWTHRLSTVVRASSIVGFIGFLLKLETGIANCSSPLCKVTAILHLTEPAVRVHM